MPRSHAIRIEAALAKLLASELGWRIVDEPVQIRGGRGHQAAASLRTRGEKPIPIEQLLRDMRINWILERSSEIIHLLIAREVVDRQLQVASDIIAPDEELLQRAQAAVRATNSCSG